MSIRKSPYERGFEAGVNEAREMEQLPKEYARGFADGKGLYAVQQSKTTTQFATGGPVSILQPGEHIVTRAEQHYERRIQRLIEENDRLKRESNTRERYIEVEAAIWREEISRLEDKISKQRERAKQERKARTIDIGPGIIKVLVPSQGAQIVIGPDGMRMAGGEEAARHLFNDLFHQPVPTPNPPQCQDPTHSKDR